MRNVVVLLVVFLMLLPSLLYSQVPEWHRELVLKVPFGDKEGEFAAPMDSKRMEYFIGESGTFVGSCFIGSTEVYIFDVYRAEVKIYELATGKFIKSIPLTWAFGKYQVGGGKLWGAEDMIVVGDTLYILLSTATIPPPGLSYYSIYTYDISSCKPLKRYRIYNWWLGTNLKFTKYPVHYGGITFLSIGEDKNIYVYDRARHKSYRIFRHGKPTPKEEHTQGITGRICGSRRYYWKGQAGQTLVLEGMEGEAISRVIPVSWQHISEDGSYLIAYINEPNRCKRCSVFYVYRYDGVAVGRIVIDYNQRRELFCGPYMSVSNDGNVYEICAFDDGVYLYRWER